MHDSLLMRLYALAVYKNLLRLPVMDSILNFLRVIETGGADAGALVSAYTDTFFRLMQEGVSGLDAYLTRHMRYDENPFAKQCASGEPDGALLDAASLDWSTLDKLCRTSCSALKRDMALLAPEVSDIVRDLPEWGTGPLEKLDVFADGYMRNGCGVFASGRAFLWSCGEIIPIESFNGIPFDHMIGYEWQREEVVSNTAALLADGRAANILLYGDSGTGKSATVKALLSIPEFYALRIIEIPGDTIEELRALLRLLRDQCQKFILFVDDISFSSDDKAYASLKSALEGGLSVKPDNVAIYATSNRRHMVRESFQDRMGDDVHVSETIQEKVSLADRFGLRIPYPALDKANFARTVLHLAGLASLNMDRDVLLTEADKWELCHGGRTPRTARQFVEQMESGRQIRH